MTIIDRPTLVATGPSLFAHASAPREAVRDVSPFLLALIPFSLAIGAASESAGLSLGQAMFAVFAVLAGSGQLAGVESIRAGSGVGVTVVIVLLVNARFAFYGAGFARWFVDLPRWKKLLLAVPLVDQTFLLCQERFSTNAETDWRVRYYATVTMCLVVCFAGCQMIGYTFGGDLPSSLGLHLAAPLAFAGMLAKSTKCTATMIAAGVSGFVLLVASGPIGTVALPVAVLTGVIAGASVDSQKSSDARSAP